ncbi:hypothetical protein BT69DRAFT_1282879 [Atractiella rhizophila]|nr:hypothetical protein BT69DRAFT_1282879 [Atractiella rhizophila]
MQLVEQTVGSLMIGTWVNTALWASEMILIYNYWADMGSLPAPLLHSAVAIVGVVDTFCTAVNMIGVYDYTISHWGKTAYLATQHWEIPAYLASTAVVGLIVQSYLTHRYFLLSRHRIVSLFLALCTLLGFGGNLAVMVGIIVWTKYTDREKVKTSVIIWFCAKAMTDISIAAALVFYLFRRRTHTVFEETRSLLVRLMLYAVETGSVTSFASLAAFGLFLHNPNSNAASAIGQCLGRLHSITFVFNLLFRSKLREKFIERQIGSLKLGSLGRKSAGKNEHIDVEAAVGSRDGENVRIERETVVSVEQARETEKWRFEKAKEFYKNRNANGRGRSPPRIDDLSFVDTAETNESSGTQDSYRDPLDDVDVEDEDEREKWER